MFHFSGSHVTAGTGEHVTYSGTAQVAGTNADWEIVAVVGSLHVKLFGRVHGVADASAAQVQVTIAAIRAIDERLGQVEDEFDIDD